MRLAIAIAVAAILVGCEAPAPQVTAQPNIAAIRASNAQTQKHIASVKTRLSSIRRHEAATDDHLRAVESDLDALIRSPVTPDPTPVPTSEVTPTPIPFRSSSPTPTPRPPYKP